MRFDDDIWPVVEGHTWKWQGDRVRIAGIVWHATRSTLPFTAEKEYQATLNWFRSPNNFVDVDDVPASQGGNPNRKFYSGMSNYVIGGGRICRAVPEDFVPRFSAGIHDFHAISVEVAQGTAGTEYDERDIALCHQFAEEASREFGFALGRLPTLDGGNTQLPGEVGHENTLQGSQQGKSDPGPLFWKAYSEDAPMTPEEREAFANLQFEHTLLLEALLGTQGEPGESQATARHRLKNRLDAMRRGEGGSIAEIIQTHFENEASHTPSRNVEENSFSDPG